MSGAQAARANGAGRRIYEHIRAQISEGIWGVGARVPSTRALAAELGVSRTTVSAAYDQLAAEGFIVTSPARAARVAAVAAGATLANGTRARPATKHRPAKLSAFGQRLQAMRFTPMPASAPLRFDFLYGAVGARDFPSMSWRRAYLAALLDLQSRLYYAPPEGDEGLRRALSGYLGRTRGLRCLPEQIVVVNGSQQAIDLCARVLLDADDTFVFEDPGYSMARRCFEATGAQGLNVPVDEHGMVTQDLPGDHRVRLAYVTPSHQFPLGGTLPIARRQELLDWARRQCAWIVEDDYDGEFRYGQHPIDALASLDTDGRVIYVGTFSKALSPQLRLGYLVLPTELQEPFQKAKRLTDRHAPVLEQRSMAALIDSGAYERHVRRMRREYERRREALLSAIARELPQGTEILGAAAGLHVVMRLPLTGLGAELALITAARRRGVAVYPLSTSFATPARKPPSQGAAFVLGYASLSSTQIVEGVRLLGEAVRELSGSDLD
ncbi:MocR-like pyridoxine biosynthesis transcription factor PdxR [Roseateles sp. PN1]|uniref:MocR-like pyridoxine biosynthesis transcription factor PdxR n=1 Tax=Roseateles sp. PN1 TaxID=3137372 RepID=UPI0031390950